MIQIKRKDNTIKETTFPHLGIYDDGVIVLFHAEGKGTCIDPIDPTNQYYIGYYSECWNMYYDIYKGSITLSNKEEENYEYKEYVVEDEDIPF